VLRSDLPVGQKIVVSLLTKEQEFQVLQAADAQRAAARGGLEIEIVYAKNNARLQVEQIYPFVHAPEKLRPAAIIAQPVAGDGLARVAADAVKAGIGWVLLNRDLPYIDALRAESPRLPIAIVTTDQTGIGRIQGRQFRSLLPQGGNVLYIEGPVDSTAAQQRLAGVQEAIAGTSITLKVLNAAWTEASAEEVVRAWLRTAASQQISTDLVGAQNDAMAIGARKAILAQRPTWSQLRFTGCDGLPDGGQRLVNEKQLAATVIVHPTAGAAVDLVAHHLRMSTPAPARLVLQPRAYPAG